MRKADKLQFVPDGPKLPLELINAHRKGRVIFFCGAGISAGPPMSLPLFPQLTACVLKHSGLPAQEDERLHFERGNYDEVLERRIAHLANGKARVRGHVRDMLTPAATRHNALHTHLLALASHDGHTRLVTTNYDQGFVWAGADQATFLDGADALTRDLNAWNSIVYLHGRLPSNGDQGWVGSNIVLTTSDFGREYTRDNARAARFLCSIMKAHSICFVGYSANDPIIRYLLTVSPDEQQFQPRYLISTEDSPPATTGVTWIPYPKGQHELLEKTLAAWARATQSNWVSVINEHLSEHPKVEANANEPAPTDALVLHALSHHEAARAFCTKRPDIRWLTEYTPIARNSNDEVGWSAPPYIVTTAWPANPGDVPALAEWMTGQLRSNEDDLAKRWRLLHWYWATHVEQYDAQGTFAALLKEFTARINRAPSELPLPWRCIHSPSQRTGTHSWDVSQLESPIDSVAQTTRDTLDQDFQPFIWFNNGEPTVRWNADHTLLHGRVPHASWHSFFTDRLGQLVELMGALGEQYLYNRWHERNGLDPHPLYTCTNLVERSLAALADSAQAESNASHGGHGADYLKRCWEGDYVWLQRLALNSPHGTNQLDKWLTDSKVYHPDFQYDLSRLLRDRRPSPDVLEAWLSFAENADNDVTQRHFAANYAVTALHHNANHASELKARAEAIRVQAKARVIDIPVYQFNMPRYRPEYASLPQLSAATNAKELIAWIDDYCAIRFPDRANDHKSTNNLSQVTRTVLIECLHMVTLPPQRHTDSQPPTRRQEILARLFRILAGSKPVELPCNKDFERELDLRLANHDDPFFRTILLPYWCTYYQPHLGAAELSRRCILALQGFNFGQLGLTEQHIRKFPDNRHSHFINTDTEDAMNQSLDLAIELANDDQLAAVDAISKLTDDSDLLFAFLIDMERVRAILGVATLTAKFLWVFASSSTRAGKAAWESLLQLDRTPAIDRIVDAYPSALLAINEHLDFTDQRNSSAANNITTQLVRLACQEPDRIDANGLMQPNKFDKAFQDGTSDNQLARFRLTFDHWPDAQLTRCAMRYMPQAPVAMQAADYSRLQQALEQRIRSLSPPYKTEAEVRLHALFASI